MEIQIASAGQAIDWMRVGMGLFGGLALFLLGMDLMAKGLQSAAGESMKVVLRKLTRHRLLGAVTGALTTAVLNSSSVTTVLVVGFVTAGMMSLAQSISVIMGANVGSTFTAQIIAFNVTRYALGLIAIGFAMTFVAKRDRVRDAGSMILGLGMIFFGMGVMGSSMGPLRNYEPFLDLMIRMENPLLGILVGAVFTGLVQSSAATTGIAIVMASEGLVPLPAGIALVFGANVGTCVTAVLAAIGKPRQAQRAAAAHVLFNVLGVLLWVAFIDLLAELVERISPSYPDLEGAARLSAEVPRQIANAHTVFNVANTLLFLPFAGLLARLVERLLPDQPEPERFVIRPKYLDEELIGTPALALERVRLEVGRQGGIVQTMLSRIKTAMLEGGRGAVESVARMDDQVDRLHEHILTYMGRIRRGGLSEHDSHDFVTLMRVSDYLESIGDVIETNIAATVEKARERNITPSATAWRMFFDLHEAVSRALHSAVRAVAHNDERAASDVIARKAEINRHIEAAVQHQAAMLASDQAMRPLIFRLEMTVVDDFKRIYTLSKRIAKASLQGRADPS